MSMRPLAKTSYIKHLGAKAGICPCGCSLYIGGGELSHAPQAISRIEHESAPQRALT